MIPSVGARTRPAPRPSRSWAKITFLLAVSAFASTAFPGRLEAAENDSAAQALDADAVAGADRVARAEALFNAGRALLKAGRAEEACPKLEESQRLDPGIGTQYNLADCYERVGKLASAQTLFLQVADSARNSGQTQREQIARQRAAELEAKVSKLVIVVPALQDADLHVERDGEELGRSEWNVAVPVDPGLHRVRASGPGLENWATDVHVAPDGSVHEVSVVINEARSFLDPLHRKIGLGAGVAGMAGVVVGTVFGVRAIAKKNEASRAGCDGRECDSPESGKIRDQARSAGNVATVGMAIGASGLAAAAVLFWVVPETGSEGDGGRAASLRVAPAVFARGGGLWLHGGF
jgi:hypothetical protein